MRGLLSPNIRSAWDSIAGGDLAKAGKDLVTDKGLSPLGWALHPFYEASKSFGEGKDAQAAKQIFEGQCRSAEVAATIATAAIGVPEGEAAGAAAAEREAVGTGAAAAERTGAAAAERTGAAAAEREAAGTGAAAAERKAAGTGAAAAERDAAGTGAAAAERGAAGAAAAEREAARTAAERDAVGTGAAAAEREAAGTAAERAAQPDIVHFTDQGQRYHFDVQNNRLVKMEGRSPPADYVSGPRDEYRIANAGRQEQPSGIVRGIQQPDGSFRIEHFDNRPRPGMTVDRGHAAAHQNAGGTDANLVPQNSDLNQGWRDSPDGQAWKAGERYLATHPDTAYWIEYEYE